MRWFRSTLLLALLSALFVLSGLLAQDSKIMGQIKFTGKTKLEKTAGIWVDGQYVGHAKELKGDKKLLLMPGKHEITARQAGYGDFVQEVLVEPGQVQTVPIKLSLNPGAQVPKTTAELKLSVQPKRAAVFLDGNYVGHAGEMGGAFHSLLTSPGKHRIKIELPGYRPFETDITLVVGQKYEVKTELVKGSIESASSDIKQPK